MLPVRLARDPAPSRLRYRLTRFWLRPWVRQGVRWGLPVSAGLALFWTLAGDLDLRGRAEAVLGAGWSAVAERPELVVTGFAIPDVSPDLAEQIREASFVALPVSSLDLNPAAIRDRVEALDAVERARVRILSGGVLEIRAIERVPVAVWRGPAGLLLLDHRGIRVAEVDSRLRRPDLPLVAGVGADRHMAEALALLDVARPVAGRVRGLVRVGERRWDLVLDRDQRIRLPARGAVEALDRVMQLHAAEDVLSRDVLAVDLRDPRRPVLRLGPDGLDNLDRLAAVLSGDEA